MSVGPNDNTRLLKGFIILNEDIPLCFNYHNTTISLLRQKHNNSIQFLTPYYGHTSKKVSGIVYCCCVFYIINWLFYCKMLQLRWKCNIYFTLAHWRVIGCLMLLNMQQNWAKMGQRQRQEQKEDMRGMTIFLIIILSKTLTPAKRWW